MKALSLAGPTQYATRRARPLVLRCAGALVALVLGSGLFVAPAAEAATANTTFNVTATVLTSCLLSATNLTFGNYSGVEIDLTSTITLTCNELIALGAANIGLDPGQSTGATVSTRKMSGPSSSLLNYSLYRDSGHTLNWGNTVGTDTYSGFIVSLLGTPVNVTVYGKLPANQYVTPGSYSDTITVTLTY